MKFILFIPFLFISNLLSGHSLESKATLPKFFKLTFTPSLFYMEPGLAYVHYVKQEMYAELNCGLLPYYYNMNEGSHGTTEQTWNGRGFTLRLKLIKTGITTRGNSHYEGLRISYKNLYYPMYCSPDGSTGLSQTLYYDETESKNIFFLEFISGRVLLKGNKFFCSTFITLGIAYAMINSTKYGYCPDHYNSSGFEFGVPRNEHSNFFRPSLSLGFTFGYDLSKKKTNIKGLLQERL